MNTEIPQTIGAPPNSPCERGIFLSNLWYQHQQTIVTAMGFDPRLVPLPGKLQNGWQPGTGLDGEQGMKLEVITDRLPFYLWSCRALNNALAEGLDWGEVIGAPFIYAFERNLPPSDNESLLAFPTHSVDPDYPVAGWEAYATDLLAFAKSNGLSPITVCLYWRDFECDSTCEVFKAKGIEVVSLGDPFKHGFLYRYEALVRKHAVVTSERVCTAGMYALWCGRPFIVHGMPLAATHPELDIGPAGDIAYLCKEFPELLRLDGKVHREVAERELGLEFKKDADGLKEAIFGRVLER